MPAAFATVADVQALAPELVSSAQLTLIVETITTNLIDLIHWGDLAFEGHRTLAAHFATSLLNSANATGVVTSRKIDKIGETYLAGPSSDADLATTKYGRLHLELRRVEGKHQREGVVDPGVGIDDDVLHMGLLLSMKSRLDRGVEWDIIIYVQGKALVAAEKINL